MKDNNIAARLRELQLKPEFDDVYDEIMCAINEIERLQAENASLYYAISEQNGLNRLMNITGRQD